MRRIKSLASGCAALQKAMGVTGMKVRGVFILAVITICGMASGWAVIRAQQPAAAAKDPNAEADEKILAEVRDHNEIMSNLEYVSDMIGARLTGSENLKKANDWTRQKFADYGVANPHLESWTIAHT
jgi:carboxypeptidase Q